MYEKLLGKISSAQFGFVWDRPFLFGLSLFFDLSDGTSIGTGGDLLVNISDEVRWSEEERNAGVTRCMDRIIKTMRDAKVNDVKDLVGKPVEVEINHNTYVSFRILTEVL